MKRNAWLVILAVGLSLIFTGGAWGQMSYSMRSAEKGFPITPKKPTSTQVFLDAAVGRPVGLATTLVGTTLFVITLPFTVPSGSTGEAAHGLIVEPGAWTFVRPLGRTEPQYEERGVFERPSPSQY
jgi:hypothetical protein